MATTREIIESALRLIGVLAAGETAGQSEAEDARVVLNQMIESFNNERLVIYEISRDTHTLTANTNPHTIGDSGNIDTTRPLRIERAGLIESGENTEYPMRILTAQEYGSISLKTTTSTIPYELWYEPEFPLGKIHLWPVPSAAQTLVLYTWAVLGTLAGLGTSVSFPPGYDELLRFNLGLRLAPEYGKEPSATVREIAAESKANIKRLNAGPEDLQVDPAISGWGGYWDYRTGEPRR